MSWKTANRSFYYATAEEPEGHCHINFVWSEGGLFVP
jgi:hypothetical protein